MDNLSLNTVDQLNNNQLPGSTLGNDGALQAGKSNSVFSANENSLQYQQLIKDIIKYLNITPEAWMALSDEEKLKNYEIYKSSLNNKIQNQNQSVNDKLVETIQNDNTNIVDETKVTEGNKKFKLDIDVHSAEWQNKTLEEKIDYFATEYSKYIAGEAWHKMSPDEQAQLKKSNLEEFAKKLPGFECISENDQKKYAEGLVASAEVLIENNVSFSDLKEMGDTEKIQLFASHLEHVMESKSERPSREQRRLLEQNKFNNNVLEFSNLDAESFDSLSAEEQAEKRYAYVQNKLKENNGNEKSLTYAERSFLSYYKVNKGLDIGFTKNRDKDLSKSFDALAYNSGASELRNYDRGSREYNQAYAKALEQSLQNLSPEETKAKLIEAFKNTDEQTIHEIRRFYKYLSDDTKSLIRSCFASNQVTDSMAAALALNGGSGELNALKDCGREGLTLKLVGKANMFETPDTRQEGISWALHQNDQKYTDAAAEGGQLLPHSERKALFRNVAHDETLEASVKEEFTVNSQKYADNDEERFFNQGAIHDTGNIDMSAGLAKSIKYLTTREARDRYDEINYNFIEGLDNVDDRKRLTDARFTGMQDLDADEQLSMFNRTMGSKHDDVVNYGASNIDRLDPSVQSDALNSVYATGNDSAVEAAVESIANSPSADVVEKVMPVTVADAAVKTFENNPEIFDALEVTASGKTIKEKIASGARLTLHEYSSLTPAEKREYFMNFFKALSPNEKIKLIKSISSTSVRNNIYKMIARTNNDLFDRLIQDPSVAEVIYNMSNVPGSIKIKIEDVANRKYLSNNAFKDMATESKDSRQEPNSTKNATPHINNRASLELLRNKYGNILT